MTGVLVQMLPSSRIATRKAAGTLQRCGSRKCPPGACDHRETDPRTVLRKAVDGRISDVPGSVPNTLRSSGVPLDPRSRRFFELRLGHDLSRVRVHADSAAARSASDVQAAAYTVGQHVVFAAGQYRPTEPSGRALLAHELIHTVQQGEVYAGAMLDVSHPDDAPEREASDMATRFENAPRDSTDESRVPWTGSRDRLGVRHGHRAQSVVGGLPIGRSTPMLALAGFWEKVTAVWGAGPIDAHRASELATESLRAAQNSGLPGLHNGPADAWRHCFWNCRMRDVIGAEDAKDVADNHERRGGGPAIENAMDYHNNDQGRQCTGDCDTCCQTRLDAGRLRIIDAGTLVPSSPTARSGGPQRGSYDKY